MFPIKTQLLTPNKYSRPQTKMAKIRGVIIHWTANENRGADAYANIRYFENRKLGKTGYGSAHYFVDSKNIVRCLPDMEMAYHVGATSYRTSKYGSYPNNCTIGIEMCVNADGNFATVYEQTVLLTASLMKRYGLNPDNHLDRHFDITGKNCPAMMTSSHWGTTNHSYAKKYGLGNNADTAWTVFKQQVKKAMAGSSITVPAKGQVATPTKNYLTLGDTGDLVKLHQDKFTRAGYPLAVDGSFGPAMRAVVIKFQKDYGLIADGFHGPTTQKRLDEVLIAMRNKPATPPVAQRNYLMEGDTGDLVRLHQDKLIRAGYPLTLDGKFGSEMKAAVMKFQKDQGLAVDGLHGPESQKRLDQVLIAMRTKPTPPPVKAPVKEEVIAVLKDIEKHWAKKNIESLYEKGITTGDLEGNFNPNQPATRAHVAAFLDRTIEYLIEYIDKKS